MDNNVKKNIAPEKFRFVQQDTKLGDKKFESKPVSYLMDAWRRFCKNKSSIVGMIIIIILLLFSLVAPFLTNYTVRDLDGHYADVLPKISTNAKGGIWDGTKKYENGTAVYQRLMAIGVESGRNAVVETYGHYDFVSTSKVNGQDVTTNSTTYSYRKDTYAAVGYVFLDLTKEQYAALQEYQNETGIQVIYPRQKDDLMFSSVDANYWYKTDKSGIAIAEDGSEALTPEAFVNIYRTGSFDDYTSVRLESDPAYGVTDPDELAEITDRYSYAKKNQSGYNVRVSYYDYYVYRNGYEPCFIFGANSKGQDLFVSVASGTRFSLMLAIGIAAVNLILGAVYGAVEGYYGGTTDLVMERVSDVLSGIPFMVVTVLFQLHLADDVGPVGALIFAFVITGWIGTASTVRMQFYRFKNQEYVLAARTLGARDRRLIMKHIFPNALGTIITSAALDIPSVIFSETSLSYLNIISLDDPASGLTSLGTLLSGGQSEMGAGYFHPILFPAIVISLLMISFNLFGNGLRDAFNPSLRGSED